MLTMAPIVDFINNSSTVFIACAFDNVIPHMLIDDLLEIGIPAPRRKFVENLISKRHLFFMVAGLLLDALDNFKGTPQGSNSKSHSLIFI